MVTYYVNKSETIPVITCHLLEEVEMAQDFAF